ncbi:MAG TPA: hypothetical protein VLA88_02660 [Candidatus Saccharimonadales bacterium]|nr:hypothetical protein [Candidatus Saccharimonadales bacterium]
MFGFMYQNRFEEKIVSVPRGTVTVLRRVPKPGWESTLEAARFLVGVACIITLVTLSTLYPNHERLILAFFTVALGLLVLTTVPWWRLRIKRMARRGASLKEMGAIRRTTLMD